MACLADHNSLAHEQVVFNDFREVLMSMQSYTKRLHRSAQNRLSIGERQRDQDSPVEIFTLRPASATARPLVLIGGMGPLAGAKGFENACRLFLNTREIVLLQACSIPDRTSVMKKLVRNPASPALSLMIDRLGVAIYHAVSQVTSDCSAIDLIVLCNTSHFFLSDALERCAKFHPDVFSRIRLVSLIESAIEAISRQGHKKAMALYTEGTRLCRIYAGSFQAKGLSYLEVKEELEPFLMRSIYGVKHFDDRVILDSGTYLFNRLRMREGEFDCILAGCTEIPFIIECLNATGDDAIKSFLRRTLLIDPVAEALARI